MKKDCTFKKGRLHFTILLLYIYEMLSIFTIQFWEELLIKYKSSLFSTLFWRALNIYENHHKYLPFFHSVSSDFLHPFLLAFSSFFLFLFFVLSFLLSFLLFSLSFLSSSILPSFLPFFLSFHSYSPISLWSFLSFFLLSFLPPSFLTCCNSQITAAKSHKL